MKKIIVAGLVLALGVGSTLSAKEFKTGDVDIGIIDNECDQLIKKSYYTMCYDNETNTPRWVIQSSKNKYYSRELVNYDIAFNKKRKNAIKARQEKFHRLKLGKGSKLTTIHDGTDIPREHRANSSVVRSKYNANNYPLANIPTHLKYNEKYANTIYNDAYEFTNRIYSFTTHSGYWSWLGVERSAAKALSPRYRSETDKPSPDTYVISGFIQTLQAKRSFDTPKNWILYDWKKDAGITTANYRIPRFYYRIIWEKGKSLRAYLIDLKKSVPIHTKWCKGCNLFFAKKKIERSFLEGLVSGDEKDYKYTLMNLEEATREHFKITGRDGLPFSRNLSMHRVPLEELEKVTGIKFFTQVKDIYGEQRHKDRVVLQEIWNASAKLGKEGSLKKHSRMYYPSQTLSDTTHGQKLYQNEGFKRPY